jgi:phosphoenolpyruvate carboxykinase (diphosphate)
VNNALVSAILTGYPGFTTAAGHIGPKYKVDHDNSMLVPELWCRMRVHERNADFLIENGYLEKVENFEYEGRKVQASRLGYRITASFVDRFLGRIFEMPSAVFPEDLLRPEKQDQAAFVAGMEAIVEAQKSVAQLYFEDGSVEAACPPIKALLHIMAHGNYEGIEESDPRLRAMFTRESLLKSDWYKQRLETKQAIDIALWTRHKAALDTPQTRERLEQVTHKKYVEELVGTIGADPSLQTIY